MRRLLLIAAFIMCASCAGGAVCTTLPAGSSQATIVSALNSCGSGNTVVLSAGSYSITSSFTLPCGVSITGPTPAPVNSGTQPYYSQTNNQSAVLNSSIGANNYGISTTASCATI